MGWGHGRFVEIDDSCFSRRKCNCGRLCMTALVVVDEQELGTPVLHLSLITPPRQCSPSLRRVSYPASQSSVTVVGTTFVSSMKDSHTMPSIAPSFLWPTDAHTNTVKATWKHINIHLRPYWENEVKHVINRFRGSQSAKFDDVPKWNVKRCVKFIAIPLDHILHLSFLIGYFPDIKITVIHSMFKKHAVFYGLCYLMCSKYSRLLTFLNYWRNVAECISYSTLK